jgi:hypothetical protein
MQYIFNFDDDWTFEVLLEAIEEAQPESGKGFQKTQKSKKRPSRKPSGEILEKYGEAPQYPDEDDE